MKAVNIASLSFGGKTGVVWSFFWRGLLVSIGSMVVAVILGFVLGLLAAAVGVPRETGLRLIQFVGAGVGIVTGFAFVYLYVRWLLSSKLGRYRLMLVASTDAAGAA